MYIFISEFNISIGILSLYMFLMYISSVHLNNILKLYIIKLWLELNNYSILGEYGYTPSQVSEYIEVSRSYYFNISVYILLKKLGIVLFNTFA